MQQAVGAAREGAPSPWRARWGRQTHPSRPRASRSSPPHFLYRPGTFASRPVMVRRWSVDESRPLPSDCAYADLRWPIDGGCWKRATRQRCRRLRRACWCVWRACAFTAPVSPGDLYSLWNSDKEKKIWYNLPQRHVSVFLCGSARRIWAPWRLSVRPMSNLFAVEKTRQRGGDEEASVRQDDLFLLFYRSPQLCAHSRRAGHKYGITFTARRVPGVCMHVGARAKLHGCRNRRKKCTKGCARSLLPPVASLVSSQNNVAELTAHITPLALKKTKCVCVCVCGFLHKRVFNMSHSHR